jgi:hypothetical protein
VNCRTPTLFIAAFLLICATPLGAQTAHGNPAAPQTQSTPNLAVKDEPGFIARARAWAREKQIVERLEGDVDGWYPRLGGMKRGSGFGGGPGYRTHVLDGHVLLDVSGALSYRFYKAVDVRARWLEAFGKRIELWTDYRLEDDPQEDFFGTGPDTRLSMRTSYTYRASDLSVHGEVKPVPWVHLGARLGYLHPWILRGRDPLFPSIEERFTDADAPGLARQPSFIHTSVFTDVDLRDVAGNPRRGGLYHAAFAHWDDRSLNAFDFNRLDATAIQHLPLNRAQTQILSPRVGLSLVNNAPGERVPFYYLPYVGGIDTIRSFREFRFADENALWLGAEYRWIVGPWWSLVGFADAGRVTHRWDQMNLSNLRPGYGGGVLIHSAKQTFARFYVGTGGGEGVRTYLSLGF